MDAKEIAGNFLDYSKEAKSFLMLLFLDGFAQMAFWFTLMLYLYYLGMSLLSIGFISAIGTFVAAATQFFAGYIADKVGRKKVLLIGVFLAAVGVWLFLLEPNMLILTIASIINGLAMAIFGPAQNAFISEKTSKKKRKYLFCLTAFFKQIGSAVSLFSIIIAVLILKDYEFSIVSTFQLFYLSYAIAYIVKIFLCFKIPERYDSKRSRSWVIPRSWKIMLKFGIANLIIGLGAGIMVPWFPVFFKLEFDVSLLTLAILFLVNSLVWAVCVLIIPLFASRFGSIRTIVVSQGLAILVIIIIPNSQIFLIAAIFFIVRIVLMNIAVPITNAFQLNLVKGHERATLTGVHFFSWQVSQATGVLIGGWLFAGTNLAIPFYVTASIYAVYIVVFYLFFRKMEVKGSGDKVHCVITEVR